jgi:hypothetical protein
VDDEESADDKLSRRDMFTREKTGELPCPLEVIFRHGFAVELVQLIHAGREVRHLFRRHPIASRPLQA